MPCCPYLRDDLLSSRSVQQPLRYMARELDPITGLYHVRNRWYDPVANRFVSEDPIGLAGGINLYAYALNSPTNLRDPMGLDPTVQACIAQLTEQRNEGSLTWTNEQIRKACGAGNGSIALPGVAGSARWDPFAQGNSILSRLMARSDDMLAGIGYPLNGHACTGGFSDERCQSIRDALTQLRTHASTICVKLGQGATRRFTQGLFKYTRRNTYGAVFTPEGQTLPADTTFLGRLAFKPGQLGNTIAHEESHHLGVGHPAAYDYGDSCAGSI